MTKALFVSDIHIGSADDPKYAQFLSFLDRCLQDTGLSYLFLVGDIFDLWIADQKWFVSRYAAAVERVRALVARGVEVHYFEGNHDLDLEVFWSDVLGVRVHTGPYEGVVCGQRVRVEHGDQMDPSDRGYLFLRWFLRTGVMRWLGRSLPGFVVRWIGERSSRASRRYTSSGLKAVADELVREKIRTHVRGVLGGGGSRGERFSVFVSGHVHVRMDEAWPDGTRVINLGTWLKEPLVLELSADAAALVPLRV